MIRMRTLAILIVFNICMPFAAIAKCGLPAQFDDLVAKLRTAMFASGGTLPQHARDLGRLFAEIDPEKVAYTLNLLDLERSRGVVDYLIRQAGVIAARRHVPNQSELQRQIKLYDQLARTACRKQSEKEAEAAQYNGISKTGLKRLNTNGAARDGSIEPPPKSLLYLALLAPGVVAILGAIAGGRLAYQWIYAFTFSHRSCKIVATLESGLDIVDGHITILGQKGLRFQPLYEDDYAWLEQLEDFEDCVIIVGSHRMYGRIDGLHGNFAVFFFDQLLSNELLSVLMEESTVLPKYVRRSTPKSNLKNRKTAGPRFAPQ